MNRARTRWHPALREIPQPGHRAGGAAIRSESDPVFPRPTRAHELTRGEHDARINLAHLLEAQAHFFHRAVELFSMTTSDTAISRLMISSPRPVRRLMPKLRLHRLDEANEGFISVHNIARMKSGCGASRF